MSNMSLMGAGPEVASAGASTTAYRDAVLADTPFVYYRHAEPSGVTATDSSGNVRHGTYNNGTTFGAPSAISDAGDSAITLASASSQYVLGPFTFNSSSATVESWIKIAAAPAAEVIIAGCINGLGSGTADKYLSIKTDGKLYFEVFDGSAKTTSAPVSTIPLNQYVHCVGTIDGVNAISYMNGAQVGTVGATGSFTGYATPNYFISGASAVPLTYINGSTDENALYSTALSAARVLAHYNAR